MTVLNKSVFIVFILFTLFWLQNAEKAKYDLIFDGLQPVNGMLTGDKVKPVINYHYLSVECCTGAGAV